jgi:hypothetical protein
VKLQQLKSHQQQWTVQQQQQQQGQHQQWQMLARKTLQHKAVSRRTALASQTWRVLQQPRVLL